VVGDRPSLMRAAKRFEIRCPVTIALSSRPKDKTEVAGVLCDIGVGGARVALDKPVQPGTKVTLFVHFQDVENKVTTIRFEGAVQRLKTEPRCEIAVGFKGSGRFQPSQIGDLYATRTAGLKNAS